LRAWEENRRFANGFQAARLPASFLLSSSREGRYATAGPGREMFSLLAVEASALAGLRASSVAVITMAERDGMSASPARA